MPPSASNPEFVIEAFEPAYRILDRQGELPNRVDTALNELVDCCGCPRKCHVNRTANETKTCGTGRFATVASAFAHSGEEACLSGWNGSGTIFFSRCNLHCVFCQNWDISQTANGRNLTAEEIADLMLALQKQGCHNINFVTPTHVVPQMIEAIAAAVLRGLNLPIVYNTNAYDSADSLRLLDGIVDIYMPDFKFWTNETASRLAKADDYPQRARDAVREMHRQVGPLCFSPQGLALHGLLVRHLVLPGKLDETAAIFHWLADEISTDTFVNIMGQYHPDHQVGRVDSSGTPRYSEINRRPTSVELSAAHEAARRAGLWRFDSRQSIIR